jgi:hypothetical protein
MPLAMKQRFDFLPSFLPDRRNDISLVIQPGTCKNTEKKTSFLAHFKQA